MTINGAGTFIGRDSHKILIKPPPIVMENTTNFLELFQIDFFGITYFMQ